MSKDRTAYVCTQCGHDSTKWLGKCPSCGEWNTFKEIRIAAETSSRAAHRAATTLRETSSATTHGALLLRNVPLRDVPRLNMGDAELDRVLGGGLVPGSIILLGGEPGIGKSTLILQTILRMKDCRVLYVSGEESAHQLKMRAERIAHPDNDSTQVLCETSLEIIFNAVEAVKPELLIIDSIQTIATESIDSSPGSVGQVKECAQSLLRFAKSSGVSVILVGHINKEGTFAGPKVLEHIVDTVLQFEGDRGHLYRLLRAVKNRFGSTDEMGIYQMQGDGLRQVSNPSELLLNQEHEGLSGIAISAAIEGMRPFLLETQALVSTAAYGTPQRASTGFDQRRLNMLLAVLEKRMGFKLAQKDVFVNIAGGLRITDLAMDLSVIAAIFSSNIDMPIPQGWCLAGEVGLSGEVRAVARVEQRIAEAEKLGFKHIIIPRYNNEKIRLTKHSIQVHGAKKVEEALRLLFG